LKDLEILFATSNKNKFAEAAAVLKKLGLTVKHYHFQHNEIRSDSLEEIAREAVAAAYKQCRQPVFVEDTGLFIKALNGFPGTYSGWVQKKIGNSGVLKLMSEATDRSAYFETCIAYRFDAEHSRTFVGRCDGSISEHASGKGGFGYDPIFTPSGCNQTFAENIELKNKLSHRYKSLLEFSKSLTLRR
jgi:XTP/dITP diphosphohydrolase